MPLHFAFFSGIVFRISVIKIWHLSSIFYCVYLASSCIFSVFSKSGILSQFLLATLAKSEIDSHIPYKLKLNLSDTFARALKQCARRLYGHAQWINTRASGAYALRISTPPLFCARILSNIRRANAYGMFIWECLCDIFRRARARAAIRNAREMCPCMRALALSRSDV